MTQTGEVSKDKTFCDARLRLNDHAIFTEFVNRDFSDNVTQWEYLGHTKGEVGIVGYETYNVASTDLYRLSVDGEITYYAVYIANRMDEDEFGVCEFVDGDLTDFMFVKMMQY